MNQPHHALPPSLGETPVEDGVALRRLHPATMIIGFFSALRNLFFPLVIVLFTQRGDNTLMWIGIVAGGIATLNAVWKYLSTRYRIVGHTFEVRRGILTKSVRYIPLEKLHDLSTQRGPLQRLLGVVEVSIETAGGGSGSSAEAKLSVIAMAEYQRLQAEITAWKQANLQKSGELPLSVPVQNGVADASVPVVLHRVSTSQLIWAGVTSNRIGPFLAFIAAGFGLLDDVIPDERIWASMKSAAGMLSIGEGHSWSYWVVLSMIAGFSVIFLAMLGSIFGMILSFHGFTLTATPVGVLRTAGLITTRSNVLPAGKIQAIEIRQGLLRRWFKLASVHVTTATGGPEADGESEKTSSDVLSPIVPFDKALQVAAFVQKKLPQAYPDLSLVDRSYIGRTFRKAALLVGLLCISPAIFVTPYWLWVIPAGVVAAWVLTYYTYRSIGYVVTEQLVWVQKGLLTRWLTILPGKNTQQLTLSQSPFERRHQVAKVSIHLASGNMIGGSASIPSVRLDVAQKLADRICQSAVSTRWEPFEGQKSRVSGE